MLARPLEASAVSDACVQLGKLKMNCPAQQAAAMMKKSKPDLKKSKTDLRINATPEQVRAALVRGGAPRQRKAASIHKQRVR